MCIYFFTSFICKKMHSGRLRYAFSDVGLKYMSYFPGFLQNMCNSFLWFSAGLTITNTNTMHTRVIDINKFVVSRSIVTDCIY